MSLSDNVLRAAKSKSPQEELKKLKSSSQEGEFKGAVKDAIHRLTWEIQGDLSNSWFLTNEAEQRERKKLSSAIEELINCGGSVGDALIGFADAGNTPKVKEYLSKGVRFEDAQKALGKAVFRREDDVIKAIVTHYEPSQYAELSSDALHTAIVFENLRYLEMFLKLGIEINSRFLYDGTILHYAAKYGHTKVVKFALDHGADLTLEHQWVDKNSTFTLAARDGNVEIVIILLNHLHKLPNPGVTVDWVVEQLFKVENLLEEKKKTFTLPPGLENSLHLYDLIENKQFKSALDWVKKHDYLAVNFLIDQGSLLHIIAQNDDEPELMEELAQILIKKHHANCYIQDKQGNCPYDIAARKNKPITQKLFSKNSHYELFRFLESHSLILLKKVLANPKALTLNCPVFYTCSTTNVVSEIELNPNHQCDLLSYEINLLQNSLELLKVTCPSLQTRFEQSFESPYEASDLYTAFTPMEHQRFQAMLSKLQTINGLIIEDNLRSISTQTSISRNTAGIVLFNDLVSQNKELEIAVKAQLDQQSEAQNSSRLLMC